MDDKNLHVDKSDKKKIVAAVVAPISLVLVLLVIIILYQKIRRNKQSGTSCFNNM